MKAIIAGLGGRGRMWLKSCRENADVEIVACVEPFADNSKRAVQEDGIAKEIIFSDLNQAVKQVKADFVLDVTPPSVHEQTALTAFENGLHVLGEKPLSDDYQAALRIVAAGKKAGLKHMVAQNYRFEGLPRTTKKLLQSGRMGSVGQLDVTLYVPWADIPGSHYVTKPYMFLTDMGIHHFDLMRYLLGMDPLSVQAVTWNLPWGWHKGDACQHILFRFPNGVMATHHGVGCTLGHVPAGHNGEWRFETPKGTLTWEGFKLFHTHKHRAEPTIREELPLDANATTGGVKSVLEEFIKSIKENRQPECNAVDNLKSMQMVFAATKSAQEKREVSLSELS